MLLAAVFLDDPSQSVSLELGEDEVAMIGRSPEASDGSLTLKIPWADRIVSRNHAQVFRTGNEISLECLPPLPGRAAPNAFYELGPPGVRERLTGPAVLQEGQSLCIGSRGKTALLWLRDEADLPAQRKAIQEACSTTSLPSHFPASGAEAEDPIDQLEELDEYSLRFQLKLLQRELPEKILLGWNTEQELMTKAADFLKTALPGQRRVSAAFLAFGEASPADYEIVNQDPSGLADFQINVKLLEQVNRYNPRPDDVQIWSSSKSHRKEVSHSSLLNRSAWILMLPIASMGLDGEVYRDSQGRPIFLYVAARKAEGPDPASLIPFVRLVSSLVASLLSAREKQRIQDKLSAHFSPPLRRLLEAGDAEALQPTLTECSVLFCDRRGVSLLMEQASNDDQIIALLQENQVIMTEISSTVFDHDGVITDFAGDGILALWGWPVGSSDHAVRAATTAESIAQRLVSYVEELPGGRRIAGIRMGISTGRIAVGNTGPVQQMHLSVFGSVVNFGARLEALGKQFRVPALISDTTCQLMRNSGKQVRKLCYLRPAGFGRSYPVFELVLPREVGGSGANPDQIAIYESALDHFVERDWEETRQLLSQLPPHDEPAHWLNQQAEFFAEHDPGPQWQGEIVSDVK